MNIIFMGTPHFAVPSLNALLHSNHKISGVVTVPDKPQGRGLKLSESPVKKFALENNLKILQPLKLKDENFLNEIRNLNADLIVIVAFRILPEELIDIPEYGCINLHASLLPKYRGAAPINWAIIKGEKETGVTTFFLKKKVDTGNIIMQQKCLIDFNDDAGSVHDKLMNIGAGTVLKTVEMISASMGNVPVLVQDEAIATPAPKIFKDNCRIQWESSSRDIYNFIRGLSPYPGSFTFYNGKILKIFKTGFPIDSSKKTVPGRITAEAGKVFIETGDSMLEISDLQLEGKKRMNISDFLRGNDIQNGHILS